MLDDELRRALRDDERLVPDLSEIRRRVLDVRHARRTRNRWWATGLMAACVVVVSTAITMAAVRVENPRESATGGYTDAASAAAESSAAAAIQQPAGSRPQQGSQQLGPTAGPGSPRPGSFGGSTADRTDPASITPEVTDINSGPEVPAVPAVFSGLDAERATAHCYGQIMAWPATDHGLVDPVALRGAVNECSVGLGNGPTVQASYALVPLSSVVHGTSLFPRGLDESYDLDQPVLVVRLDGSFTDLADGRSVPTAVQIYLTANNKWWFGIQARNPTDLASFGAPVNTLH